MTAWAEGQGTKYEPATPEVMERRLRQADQPGQHLWIMTAMWRMADPAAAARDPGPTQLDAENLVGMAGPGCYKCEHPYSRRLAAKVCRGSI